jgi:hypothetical protein
MRSLPITATGRLLCHVHRAVDATVRRNPLTRHPSDDESLPQDVGIVERELTRC